MQFSGRNTGSNSVSAREKQDVARRLEQLAKEDADSDVERKERLQRTVRVEPINAQQFQVDSDDDVEMKDAPQLDDENMLQTLLPTFVPGESLHNENEDDTPEQATIEIRCFDENETLNNDSQPPSTAPSEEEKHNCDTARCRLDTDDILNCPRWNKCCQRLLGLPSLKAVKLFHDAIQDTFDCPLHHVSVKVKRERQYKGNAGTHKPFRSSLQELIMFLLMMKSGMDNFMVAMLFNVQEPAMASIFFRWLVIVHTFLDIHMSNPQKVNVNMSRPERYRVSRFGKNVRLTIDTFPITVSRPSEPKLNNTFYNYYYGRHVAKILLGIAPIGGVTLCSQAFPGKITDNDITEAAKVADFVEQGDHVSADKGFTCFLYFSEEGKVLITPLRRDSQRQNKSTVTDPTGKNRSKKKKISQYGQAEAIQGLSVAKLRSDVERAIARVKDWKVLQRIWPLCRLDLISMTVRVAARMTNFLGPLNPDDNEYIRGKCMARLLWPGMGQGVTM